MQKEFFTCIIFLSLCYQSKSSNILFISAVGSPSHHLWNKVLALGLIDRGHNLTYISPDEDNEPKPKNYSFIQLEGVYNGLHINFDINEMADYSALKMIRIFQEWSILQCNSMLRSKGLRYLWDYPEDFQFDLILVDVTLGSCLYHLIQRFGYPPTVGVTAFLLPPYASFSFGNHLFPSYLPWYGLSYSHRMTFPQRVLNFVFTVSDIYLRTNVEAFEEEKIAREIFGNDLAPWQHIERHIGLLLANINAVLELPQILPPNIIPVGGLQTRFAGTLPQDLQNMLDNAEDGVIVFSLGTNVRSDKLSENIQKVLLDTFSKLSQVVFWKFESTIQNVTKNVVVRSWLPQNDIVGHPNVKLFIGHGGALSTHEAIFHGVPMLVMPFCDDQHINAQKIADKRLGLQMDFRTITVDSLLSSIEEVLHNPIYRSNAKLASIRFRDLPRKPLENAVFWVEYAMRHQGAKFLDSPARDMPFYVSSSFDVITFVILSTIATVMVLFRMMVFISKQFILPRKFKIKLH